MTRKSISGESIIRDVVTAYPGVKDVFQAHGLKCSSCWISAVETIFGGARTHRIEVEPLLRDIHQFLADGTLPRVTGSPLLPMAQKVPAEKLDKGDIGHIVAVMSGKGGVGKSLVTGLLAVSLARSGYRVGILDADITGPSIPKMFGLHQRVPVRQKRIEPGMSMYGIKIMSMNLMLEREDIGVTWRGPMVSQSIKQFFSDVAWGELDYLLVDLPPGTSDAPMTVLQALPLDGVVLVSTPQALTGMVVSKAIKMVQKMHVPILGLVENMGYLILPDSGQPFELFGPSQSAALVGESGAPMIGRLPLDPEIARLCDAGKIEEYHSAPYAELSENLHTALDIAEAVPV